MTEERLREIVDDLIGFIADRFEMDGLFDIAYHLGISTEELDELGWISHDDEED